MKKYKYIIYPTLLILFLISPFGIEYYISILLNNKINFNEPVNLNKFIAMEALRTKDELNFQCTSKDRKIFYPLCNLLSVITGTVQANNYQEELENLLNNNVIKNEAINKTDKTDQINLTEISLLTREEYKTNRTITRQARQRKQNDKNKDYIYISFKNKDGSLEEKELLFHSDNSESKKNKLSASMRYKNKASTAIVRKNYKRALLLLDQAKSYDPNNADIYFLEGKAYYLEALVSFSKRDTQKLKTNWDKALQAFKFYLRNRSNKNTKTESNSKHKTSASYFYLAKIYDKKKLYFNAQHYYSLTLKLQPELRGPRLKLAKNLVKQKKYQEAKKQLSQLLKYNSRDWEAYYVLSSIYLFKGEAKKALTSINKSISLNPKKMLSHQHKAKVLYEMKLYKKASRSLRQAIKKDKSNHTNWSLLGKSLQAQKLNRKALVAFLQAKRIKPGDAKMHYQIGQLYLKLRNNRKALKSFETSLAIRPNYKEACLASLAISQKRRGFQILERTIKHFEPSPQNYNFYMGAANFYFRHNYLGKAQKTYRLAINSKKQVAKPYLQLAEILKKLKKYREAELSYKELLKNAPNYIETHRLIGLLYHHNMGLPKKAKKHLEMYLSMHSSQSLSQSSSRSIESITKLKNKYQQYQ